jgi:cysteine synthase
VTRANAKSKGVYGKYERFLTDTVQVADDPACNIARLFVIRGLAVGPQTGESTLAMVRLVSSSNPAIGCLVVVTATDETGKTPAAILPPAYYLVPPTHLD